MKKKTFIFLVLFLSVIFGYGENESIVKGRIERKPDKSNESTVFAYLVDETVQIEFLEEYNGITITIEDSFGGVVFYDVINTTEGMVYSIDVSNFETGEYLLRVKSKSGGEISGYFYLK